MIKRKDQKEEPRLCRACGVPLMTKPEEHIGVHIACVQNANVQSLKTLPRPRYGTSK